MADLAKAPVGIGSVYRPTMLGLALLFLAALPAVWTAKLGAFVRTNAVGLDYWSFVDEGHRLLDRGTPYMPYQLAGPYSAYEPSRLLHPDVVPFLYPPPYALVGVVAGAVPWVLWWAIPLGLTAAIVLSWRPAPWTWPLLGFALIWPHTATVIAVGGSTMWVTALVAAGLRWGWPAVLIVLKPSFLPFALLGIRHRSWWVAVAVMGVVSLAMLPLWFDYLAAMRNVTDVRPWYSLGDLPFVLLPVVAYLGRTRGSTDTELSRSRTPRSTGAPLPTQGPEPGGSRAAG